MLCRYAISLIQKEKYARACHAISRFHVSLNQRSKSVFYRLSIHLVRQLEARLYSWLGAPSFLFTVKFLWAEAKITWVELARMLIPEQRSRRLHEKIQWKSLVLLWTGGWRCFCRCLLAPMMNEYRVHLEICLLLLAFYGGYEEDEWVGEEDLGKWPLVTVERNEGSRGSKLRKKSTKVGIR